MKILNLLPISQKASKYKGFERILLVHFVQFIL